MLPSIFSRCACLPTENGDAERLTIACGAGANELLDRIVVVAAPLPEVAIVPDVFADADAEPASGDVQRLRAVKRLEVPILVEDVVGRQERLAKTMFDAAAAEKRRGVEQRSSLVRRIRLGQSDERRRAVGERDGEPLEPFPASGDEIAGQQQIARQIADERQLRRDGEIGAPAPGLARRVGDQARVALEIADRRIDLQECDLHRQAGRDVAPARPDAWDTSRLIQ